MTDADAGCGAHGGGFSATVCLCNSNIPWGGGETWHYNTAVSLAGRGWRVLLMCHPEGELYKRAKSLTEGGGSGPGISLVPWPLGRLSFINPVTRLRLTAFFRREQVHAVIMNLPSDVKAVAPTARAAGVPHVVYRRGSALPVKDSLLNRWLYGRVITRLIVNSRATRAQVLANNPRLIPEERISVLPNGIDVAGFDAALAACGNLREETRPGARPFVLGNAGRLSRQKGQHILLYLCKELAAAGLDCRLVIAGEGERRQELELLARTLGVADRVRFLGFCADLSAFWNDIDVFVLSSLWEGFGYVLVEAMLAEKPVFAFAVSNMPELVEDGVNGRLFSVPEEDAADCPEAAHEKDAPAEGPPRADSAEAPYSRSLAPLVTAVLKLNAQPEERARMGSAGRAFALRFSQERCMDDLEALLCAKATRP